MTACVEESVAAGEETYWVDDNAARAVLLIDDATQAITEALHHLRCGSALEHRDLIAAGVAVGDLLGGLAGYGGR